MEVKREEFERYLRGLPPDESFCLRHNCPLAQYGGRAWSPEGMQDWMWDFTERVDHGPQLWGDVTPVQCLAILAKVA